MNINNYQNQMNYTNNFYQTDKMNIKNNNMYYQIRNNQPNYTNINNSLDTYDKRLVLCLKYLGLNKYVPNFIKRGIRFEDFLSFSNNDLASLKIPSKIQEIIQKFILTYLGCGSMYTVEEIIQFFKTRRVKKYFPKDNGLNINDRNKEYINNIKYKSVNQRRDYNNNHYTNLGGYNNIQRNVDNNLNEKRRPKSQSNTIIRNQNYNMKKNQIPNNMNQKILMNNNNSNTNKLNNFRTSQKKGNNNIQRKNIPNNLYDITTNSNSNISSLLSSQKNFNAYTPSLDNFSHMAINESPQLLNMMKMTKHKQINVNNLNLLKKNLGKKFPKTKKDNINKINNDINNNRNKKVITDNINENIGLSRSTSKDIIDRMNEVLKRYESRKKSSNSSTNLNLNNKGYHSDGYLKEKNNHYNNDFNNINLEGYELNTYYAGDTSKFSSIGGDNNFFSEIKKIKKGGNVFHPKTNKAKKINEEQARKIEYLLSHGGNSSLKYNNYMMKNNFDIYNDEEFSLTSDNKSKTNYTNLTNNINPELFGNKNSYINQVNNNINNIKQKNLLIQKHPYKHKMTKNKPNNFNTYASNRGNISSNYYQNNKAVENGRINNNIVHIPNTQNRIKKNEGPIQISVKNRKKIKNNNYINISPNYNNNIPRERGNNFNSGNNSTSNFSMGNKMNNYNNIMKYPLNNYINAFIGINNNKEPKRNTKSYEKNMKNNRVYAGIHNINNNINNININNINYDGKRLSQEFDNFVDLDMKMNYHRTQDNFYEPNNLLNNNDILNEFY